MSPTPGQRSSSGPPSPFRRPGSPSSNDQVVKGRSAANKKVAQAAAPKGSPTRARIPRVDGPGVGLVEQVTIERLVAGGDGLGRLADGRVVFVPYVASGETVTIEVTSSRKDHVRGKVSALMTSSEVRVEPPCPKVAFGCGGCAWQHLSLSSQHESKVEIVRDAFRRIARIDDVESVVRKGGSILDPAPHTGAHTGADDDTDDDTAKSAWRTTVRASVNRKGVAGFRVAGTHDICVSGACLVAHPAIAHILEHGLFPGKEEVFIRVGVSSQETVVVVSGHTTSVKVPEVSGAHGCAGWSPAQVLSWEELNIGLPGAVHEKIDGVNFQVAASSFFQSGPAAASLLVQTVKDALHPYGTAEVFVDLYGGVGLFAATVGRKAQTIMVIEESLSSVNDAEVNLSMTALVHRKDVTEWEPPRVVRRSSKTHVVADPARTGLGLRGVAAIRSAEPEVVVLVSCDAAAGARDVALFMKAGWVCRSATVLEVFPHTAHVEVVCVLEPNS